ncbi:MAG: ubiquinol-cytochrome c reductase iron-sulfur subunit [Acidobacteriota bacterium]
MALIDDLGQEQDERDLSRRKLLGLLGSGALATAMGGTAAMSVQYISPNVLYEAASRIKVGRPETIAVGTVLVLPRQKVYVVRTAEGFYAMSSICTHLGCMTRHEAAEGRFFCPCHGSHYSLDGRVTGGPAPRPLPRLDLQLENGVLIVDAKKPAAPDFLLKV